VTAWHRVGVATDFADGVVREIRIGDRILAVGRADGELFCLDDWCPHAGASLAQGMLDDGVLVCPLHGYAYDVRTGRCEDDPTPAATFPVREKDGEVEVEL
jgi:nitrite reductase/ring-hydroxylating ferredoxin subunit